jgi:hypothetical protein
MYIYFFLFENAGVKRFFEFFAIPSLICSFLISHIPKPMDQWVQMLFYPHANLGTRKKMRKINSRSSPQYVVIPFGGQETSWFGKTKIWIV